MKKLFFALITSLALGLCVPVYISETNAESGQRVQNRNQQERGSSVSPIPTGSQIQNRNQVNTENQGQDFQLRVNTQEQENLESGKGEGLQNRNQNTLRNASEVANQVQELLQIRTEGGIGEQVRQIAREQNRAQEKIQEQLTKLESRGKLTKLLIGTDYGAVKNLKQEIEQNQLRIRELEQLQSRLSNKGDLVMVQAAIQVLTRQNTFLQERITAEEKAKSLFGWLFRFLAR